jgi:hypothetical protein
MKLSRLIVTGWFLLSGIGSLIFGVLVVFNQIRVFVYTDYPAFFVPGSG